MTEPTGERFAGDPPPALRGAVVDLLGVLAYGQLTAFSRLAADAESAPDLLDRVSIAELAGRQLAGFDLIAERIQYLGVPVAEAMRPFVGPIDAFHQRTRPANWLEGLVKAYVGDGIAADFYREISAYLDSDTHQLVDRVAATDQAGEVLVKMVRGRIEADPAISGRLALWARRLVAEALSQAQRVAADRDNLTGLLVGSSELPGADLAELVAIFGRITTSHQGRMSQLGLSA
jgi:hypothetical protein